MFVWVAVHFTAVTLCWHVCEIYSFMNEIQQQSVLFCSAVASATDAIILDNAY